MPVYASFCFGSLSQPPRTYCNIWQSYTRTVDRSDRVSSSQPCGTSPCRGHPEGFADHPRRPCPLLLRPPGPIAGGKGDTDGCLLGALPIWPRLFYKRLMKGTVDYHRETTHLKLLPEGRARKSRNGTEPLQTLCCLQAADPALRLQPPSTHTSLLLRTPYFPNWWFQPFPGLESA